MSKTRKPLRVATKADSGPPPKNERGLYTATCEGIGTCSTVAIIRLRDAAAAQALEWLASVVADCRRN